MVYQSVPPIAVIIPIYNVQRYLAECIDSVLNQGLSQVHLYLINDASTDGSLKIAQAYRQRYPEQIFLVDKSRNGGLAAARNTGLDFLEQTGRTYEFIHYLDSDDALNPNAYQRVFDQGIDVDTDLINCAFEHWFADDSTRWAGVLPQKTLTQADFAYHYITYQKGHEIHDFLGNKLFKASFIHGLRFHPQIPYAEDWDYILMHIIPKLKKCICLNTALFKYRARRSSLSNATPDAQKILITFDKVEAVLDQYPPQAKEALINRLFDYRRQRLFYTLKNKEETYLNIHLFKKVLTQFKREKLFRYYYYFLPKKLVYFYLTHKKIKTPAPQQLTSTNNYFP